MIEIKEYRNAIYVDELNEMVDCEINHPTSGWIPYTLSLNDTGTYIDNEKLLSLMKSNNDITPVDLVALDNKKEKLVRFQRDSILKDEIDPLVTNPLRWGDLTIEQQEQIKTYRQELLDITNQTGFPTDVIWPVKPSI